MSSVNKVIIVGRLGRDPEVRYMPNGEAVANLTLATSETWKDKTSGEKKEATEWHRVTLYRRLAEVAGQYLKKGSLVYFEGKLQTRKWTDKEGVERYTTEIIADTMQMLGNSQGGGQEENAASSAQDYQGAKNGSKTPQQSRAPANSWGDMDDDIPFE